MGLAQEAAHNHCSLPETSQPHVNVFIDRFLKDKKGVNATIFYTGGDFKYEDKDCVKWNVPRL
jgi:hypothetical protein